MSTNIGAQAADAVNEKLVERQKLEQEMLAHHQDLQTLISQRNENEMVKEVRKSWLACIRVTTLTAYFGFITSHLLIFSIISIIDPPTAAAATFLYLR